MFTKRDRAILIALEQTLSRLVTVVSTQNSQLDTIRAELNDVLDTAGASDMDARLQEGINNIMAFTGAPKRGESK